MDSIDVFRPCTGQSRWFWKQENAKLLFISEKWQVDAHARLTSLLDPKDGKNKAVLYLFSCQSSKQLLLWLYCLARNKIRPVFIDSNRRGRRQVKNREDVFVSEMFRTGSERTHQNHSGASTLCFYEPLHFKRGWTHFPESLSEQSKLE